MAPLPLFLEKSLQVRGVVHPGGGDAEVEQRYPGAAGGERGEGGKLFQNLGAVLAGKENGGGVGRASR